MFHRKRTTLLTEHFNVSKNPMGENTAHQSAQSRETQVLFFLTCLLAPALAIAIVGGYGLLVWVFQMLAGPPGSG